MTPLDSCSSGATCWLADHDSARMPSCMDSTRVATPRARGTLAHFFDQAGASFTSVRISPSGVRTATAQVVAPRIITPSITAWPPT